MQSAQLGMAATSLSPWERSAEAEAERLEREAEDGWQRWTPPHLDDWLVDDCTEADVAALWRLLVLAVDDETGEERAYGEEEAAACARVVAVVRRGPQHRPDSPIREELMQMCLPGVAATWRQLLAWSCAPSRSTATTSGRRDKARAVLLGAVGAAPASGFARWAFFVCAMAIAHARMQQGAGQDDAAEAATPAARAEDWARRLGGTAPSIDGRTTPPWRRPVPESAEDGADGADDEPVDDSPDLDQYYCDRCVVGTISDRRGARP